jgi:hypothetical protein
MISKRAWLLGRPTSGLERLLSDVAGEVGLALAFVAPESGADVVFAVVSPGDVVSVLYVARRNGTAPIIALLAVGDERLARRAVDCGAQACWALDTSLDLLRFHLLTLVASPAPQPASARSAFRLGRHARRLMEALRRSSTADGYPASAITPDAERRLEVAMRLDLKREVPRPFRLGVRARLELSLMRLAGTAIERIEQAVVADLEDSERVA